MRKPKHQDIPTLSPREQEILALIWQGLKNREIAAGLKISIKTVEGYRASSMKKLRATSVVQLLKIGLQRGFIQLQDRSSI